MTEMIGLFVARGAGTLFLGVLVEQLGLPLPAMPLLLLAGARSSSSGLLALQSLAAAAAGSMVADLFWFLTGRRYGRSVLTLLCRFSSSSHACVQRSQACFARRGVMTLLFAKFIPGVSAFSTPVAGAMGMRVGTFVLVNLAGTLLWAGSGIAAGMLFHEEVHAAIRALEGVGSRASAVMLSALAAYAAWRGARRMLAARTSRCRG